MKKIKNPMKPGKVYTISLGQKKSKGFTEYCKKEDCDSKTVISEIADKFLEKLKK